ncbi:MAG: ABC transporter permease [Methanomassiliicoccales archaeon]|nr:ABC transporter permease [Methanomassiliicoccales archaeon]
MELGFHLVGLRALVTFSSKKLLLNRRWVIVALMAALVAVVMLYVASEGSGTIDEGSTLINTLILSFLLPIMSLIYGASMIRNEIDDRSITQVVTSPMDRRVAYIGYYLSLCVVLSVMLVIIESVGWASFFLTTSVDGEAVELLLSYALLLVIGSFVYSSLFLLLGVVFRQPIYLGLLYVFVWEALVGSLPGAIGQYTISYYIKVIGSHLIPYGNITQFSGDAGVAALVLAALAAVFLIIGAWAFREKEIP